MASKGVGLSLDVWTSRKALIFITEYIHDVRFIIS